MNKQYNVQVLGHDGLTAIKTLSPSLLKNVPQFSSQLNGGLGECVLDLNLPFDDFDEGTSIDYMNIVDIYAVDAENPRGRRIYRGFISRYEPYLDSQGNEGIRVTLLGLVSLLTYGYYKNGGSFSVSHTTVDPETIGRAVIDHFDGLYPDLLSYSADSTDPIGTNVTVAFSDQKWIDALKKVGQLADGGWWWKVDQDGIYWLKAKPSTPTHRFTIGSRGAGTATVDSVKVTKDSEKVVNDVVVRWTDLASVAQTATASDAPSQVTYGIRTTLVSDSTSKSAAAASQVADKEVADGKDAKVATQLVVNQNYDLESIHVGETVTIANVKKGSTLFGANMQIVSLSYSGDRVSLQLEAQTANFGQELEALIAA